MRGKRKEFFLQCNKRCPPTNPKRERMPLFLEQIAKKEGHLLFFWLRGKRRKKGRKKEKGKRKKEKRKKEKEKGINSKRKRVSGKGKVWERLLRESEEGKREGRRKQWGFKRKLKSSNRIFCNIRKEIDDLKAQLSSKKEEMKSLKKRLTIDESVFLSFLFLMDC